MKGFIDPYIFPIWIILSQFGGFLYIKTNYNNSWGSRTGPFTSVKIWRSTTMLLNIIVLSSSYLWSIKFNIQDFVLWIINIMIANVLVYLHHCSLGYPTSMPAEQCWHLHIIIGLYTLIDWTRLDWTGLLDSFLN